MPDIRNSQYSGADDAEPRLVRERRLLDEARAEAAQGMLLSGPEVEAWLDGLEGDAALPLPSQLWYITGSSSGPHPATDGIAARHS